MGAYLVFKLNRHGSASGITMTARKLLPEVKALNETFLRLVRRVLEADFEAGRSALGVSAEMANALLSLSDERCMAVASTNLLLCCIRFDDPILMRLLGNGRGLALDPAPHPQPYESDGSPLSISNTVGDSSTSPNR
ncbi:hypothetical protein BL248_23455 [Ralstonia solanacearum]|nr:hypothetical protein BL248_23455 [Ralstonia solanacearum]